MEPTATATDDSLAPDVVEVTDPNALPKAYEPHAVEAAWYPVWEKRGYFHAESKSNKTPFAIVVPPPNVTGSLHMGHGLNMTLQDIVTRMRRMQGHNTCWLPGMDHAGIATQMVVERELAKEGTTRQQLGREAFVKRVWEWKKQSGGIIANQLRKLGASCDWERERFTMDDGLSRAVKEAFVRLHEDGLLYRGERLISWCPRCLTAISDLEVEHDEVAGHLWHIRYPLPNGERNGEGDDFLTVATTRPETMLGDVAVAVHPDDERYQALIGHTVQLPLTGRTIPIIADARVEQSFGTGVVKITPAHDPLDFQIGADHQLPRINIMQQDGTLNDAAGQYAGLERFAARARIVADLEAASLLAQTDEHRHAIGHCQRCKTIVEPLLSKQWFVKTEPLAKKAIAAVRTGKTEFIPKNWEKTYFHWMDNIQDWCVSRQLWWGHRIPAWYCAAAQTDAGPCTPLVARDKPQRCPTCGSLELTQDDDVLDTWFSSGLWPFSTFGWPDKNTSLTTFYPTSVLVTGFDIIFFWVARMMMLGLHFMDAVPFKQVYIHALVRDPLGQKMSKTKGNVIDPLELMERFGTDAFRFTLASLAAQGRDIRISDQRVEGNRHFANKLWNAARFLFMQWESGSQDFTEAPPAKNLGLADRWILNRLEMTGYAVTAAITAYDFDVAARELYRFIWHEFCDWYLEVSKQRMRSTKAADRYATLHTLCTVFDGILRLLHPFMPFITEELWQQLQTRMTGTTSPSRSIMVAPWPVVKRKPPRFAKDAEAMQYLMAIVSAIRTIRSEHQISPAARVVAIIQSEHAVIRDLLGTHSHYVRELARLSRLEVRLTLVTGELAATAATDVAQIYVPLAGLIDVAHERERLAKEIEKLDKTIGGLTHQLGNADFLARAPKDIVATEQERLAQSHTQRARFATVLEQLQ